MSYQGIHFGLQLLVIVIIIHIQFFLRTQKQ